MNDVAFHDVPRTDMAGRFWPAGQAAAAPFVHRLAFALAMAGGLTLVAMAFLTVFAVTRASQVFVFAPDIANALRTIEGGYYELIEAGTGFAIFAMLPWCQLRRGHVTVDVFVSRFGPRAMAGFAFVGNLLLTLAAALIAWRLWLGTWEKATGFLETTFTLQLPVWWGYAAAMFGAVAFLIVCFWTCWRSANEMTGSGELPDGAGRR